MKKAEAILKSVFRFAQDLANCTCAWHGHAWTPHTTAYSGSTWTSIAANRLFVFPEVVFGQMFRRHVKQPMQKNKKDLSFFGFSQFFNHHFIQQPKKPWVFLVPQIAIAIRVLTSNKGGGRRTTLADWTWHQGAIAGAVDVVPSQGATVVCYGWGGGDDQLWGSGRWTLLGASAGCHCSVLWLGGGGFLCIDNPKIVFCYLGSMLV